MPMNENDNSFYPTTRQAINLALIFLMYSVLTSIPAAIVKSEKVLGKETESILTWVGYVAAVLLTIYTGINRMRRNDSQPFQWNFNKFPVVPMLISIAMVLTIGFFTDPFGVLLPMPDFVKKMFADTMQHDILSILIVVLVGPLLEEILFRGIILQGLLKNYPPQNAIIISGLIFACIHLNPWQAIPVFFGGYLMGWMYYKTKSIIPGMILHITNNLFAVLADFKYHNIDNLKDLFSTKMYIVIVLLAAFIYIAGYTLLARFFEDEDLEEYDEEVIEDTYSKK
jgi:membrane protease YdiL (CAAX protease family)